MTEEFEARQAKMDELRHHMEMVFSLNRELNQDVVLEEALNDAAEMLGFEFDIG